MKKSFIKRHGLTIIFCGFAVIIFLFGFSIGNGGENVPAEAITTKEGIKTEATTETTAEYTEITVNATAYCPCKKCSGKWGTLTATGTEAEQGRTVAVDPNVIPYGTEIIINGNTYIAEDCGEAIKGNDVDIYFENHNEAKQFGRQQLIAKVKK